MAIKRREREDEEDVPRGGRRTGDHPRRQGESTGMEGSRRKGARDVRADPPPDRLTARRRRTFPHVNKVDGAWGVGGEIVVVVFIGAKVDGEVEVPGKPRVL